MRRGFREPTRRVVLGSDEQVDHPFGLYWRLSPSKWQHISTAPSNAIRNSAETVITASEDFAASKWRSEGFVFPALVGWLVKYLGI